MKKQLFFLAFLFIRTVGVQGQVSKYFVPAPPDKMDSAIVEGSVFNNKTGYSNFNGVCFKENVKFSQAKLPKPANFYSSTFNRDADFSSVQFGSFADFSGATFKKDATFTNCRFNYFLFMAGIYAEAATDFNFYNARFPDVIDFSHNTNLFKTVDFTTANFDSVKTIKRSFQFTIKGSFLSALKRHFILDTRHFINLFNTDITKIKIGYLNFRLSFYDPSKNDPVLEDSLRTLDERFKSKTIIDGKNELGTFVSSPEYKTYIAKVFPSAIISDTLIKNFTAFYFKSRNFPTRLHPDQIDAIYSRLRKNFDDNGQRDSFELLDIEYQDFIWTQKNVAFRWLYVFPKYWNFYGNNREMILIWTPGLLLLLTFITFLFYNKVFDEESANKVIYHVRNIPKITSEIKNPGWFKFKNSFILTSVIFFSFSLKTEKLDFKKPVFFYVIVINILGLLCLAYLANYVLQK